MAAQKSQGRYQNVFGDWSVRDYLGGGSGGRTAVFRLERSKLGWQETCALKVVSLMEEAGRWSECSPQRQQAYRETCRERSLQASEEVRLMARLGGCTNVVDYLDYQVMDWADEDRFGQDLLIRMELLAPLSTMVRGGLAYDRNNILKLGQDICRALILCHESGIIHRDIKPANIFCNRRTDFKLGDFGIARLLERGEQACTAMGTRAYAAPEQFTMGESGYDSRVDIYSLGLTLYELSNENRLPFAQNQYVREADVLARLRGEPFPVPSMADPALARVILKACAHRAEERYQSAREMYDALEALRPETQRLDRAAAPQPYATVVLNPPVQQTAGQTEKLERPEVLFQRGQDYKLGRGVEKDLARAAEWFGKAANQGYAPAQYAMGLAMEFGQGAPKDPARAAGWYEKAAGQGHAPAQHAMGLVCEFGKGGEKDPKQAAEWYEKAAGQGYAPAQYAMGLACEFGKGRAKHPGEAVRWYEKAARQDNADAQCALGTCYYNGTGVERDYVQAAQWYEKAARQGHARGAFNLGTCLEYGRGVSKDPVRATEWYEKAAGQGYVPAQYAMGLACEFGKGTAKDPQRAVQWYEKAARQGNANAQCALGTCLYNGTGVEQNYVQAAQWYEKAARQGHTRGAFNLGLCLEYGKGGPQNLAEAVKWYEKAARQGHQKACYRLGQCMEKGSGGAPDYVKAAQRYQKGIEQGDEACQKALLNCIQMDGA